MQDEQYEDEFEDEDSASSTSPAPELSMDLEEFMALQSPSAAAYTADDAELPPELRPLEGVSPVPNARPSNLPIELFSMEDVSTAFSGESVNEKQVRRSSSDKTKNTQSRCSKKSSINEADIKLLDAQIASLQSDLIKDQGRSNSGIKAEKGLPSRKLRDGAEASLPESKHIATSGRRFLEKQSSAKKRVVSESAEIRRLTAEIQERDVLLDRLSKNSLKLAQDCDTLRVEVMRLRKLLKEEREHFASRLKEKGSPVDKAPRSNRENALLEAVSCLIPL